MSDEKVPDRGLGDMATGEFRRAARDVADRVADYLEQLESYDVLPKIEPGEVRARLGATPPEKPESMQSILEDFADIIQPNITHWQHPGFMAYFPSVASGPGILGEWLSAGLNSNVMFWRNAPASTELEQTVVDWLRRMLGLPAVFDGMLTDTASISSLLSIVAARHAVPGLDAREKGLAGREGLGRLRIYASSESHMTIDKAAIVVGAGTEGLRKIEVDDQYRMRPDTLERAIAEDRTAGWLPFCVVATLGTTSSTSVDPAARIADICEREGLWFHVDAAYAGSAAVAREYRPLLEGWERANSIVVNPHKWLFTPFDASLLLFRDADAYRDAFSIVPEYLRTPVGDEARNYNEYGIQLGRRFRALKLWMQIRYFGTEGIAARIREHCRMAGEFARWVEADPDWELMAPVPFATVCYRYRPASMTDPLDAAASRRLDGWNESILAEVNRSGKIFLSHTILRSRFTLRLSVGNPRQTMEHVETCWRLLRQAAKGLNG